MAALDQAGELLEILLILGNVATDNRRYTAAGFPSVGGTLGGAGGHTPADTAERCSWQLAF
jgi:aminopeptidase YwaD